MNKQITLDGSPVQASVPFEAILSSINGGVVVTELGAGFPLRTISDGCLRMLGYTFEELQKITGGQAANLIIDEDRLSTEISVRQQLEESGEVCCECRVRKRDGNIVWTLMQGRQVRNEDGLFAFCSVLIDISNLKAEKSLYNNDRGKSLKSPLSSENRYRSALEQIGYVLFDYDIARRRIQISSELSKKYQLPSLLNGVPQLLIDEGTIHPESEDACVRLFREIEDGKTVSRCTVRIRSCDGQYKWCECTLCVACSEHSHDGYAIGIIKNITKQKEKEWRLLKERRFHEALLSSAIRIYKANITKDQTLEGFEDWDKVFGIVPTSCYSDMIMAVAAKGICSEDAERFSQLFSTSNVKDAFHRGQTEITMEYRRAYVGQPMLWVQCTMNLLLDPDTGDIMAICSIRNIDSQKKREFEMQYRAERDSLSKLYNHGTTKQHITEFLNSDEGRRNQHALLILDIDNFKAVNDLHGHLQGDIVLAGIADNLKEIFRSTDILGRVGGDEFILFLKNISTPETASRKAREVNQAIQSLYDSPHSHICVSVSIGIALCPAHGTTFEELYQNADIALYQAKRSGKNSLMVYSPNAQQNSR